MAITLAPYKGIFGMPPPAYVTDEMIENSMPVLEITPGEPNFSLGLTLFTINTIRGWKNYGEILSNHGFNLGKLNSPLKFAFIADNFPTDTFSNEYTETFLQKFTDVASSGLSQLIQMSGQKDALGAGAEYSKILAEVGQQIGGSAGKLLSSAAGMTAQGVEGVKGWLKQAGGSDSATARMLGGGMSLVNKMLAGHRIDFPQIWSNSGYSPSYSATIRLYNPNPGDKNSTLQYIAGPICALLCLAVPRTLNGASYRWPFYHRIRVRGLYELDPAVITNITVVKGGDQQQIGYSQMMGMCDVRIDFISLHKSMLLEEGGPAAENRPTVRRYIREMTNGRDVHTRAEMNNENNKNTNAGASIQKRKAQTFAQSEKFDRNLSAAIRLPQAKSGPSVIERRVTAQAEKEAADLKAEAADGIYLEPVEEVPVFGGIGAS